jgi:hypothetical protein
VQPGPVTAPRSFARDDISDAIVPKAHAATSQAARLACLFLNAVIERRKSLLS